MKFQLTVSVFCLALMGCAEAPSTSEVSPAASPTTQTSGATAAAASDNPVPAQAATPATAAEAAKVLDLRTFPRLASEVDETVPTIAQLDYAAKAKTKEAFEHHRAELLKQGWKEGPNAYVTDESASSTFSKQGFQLALSVFPSEDEVSISIHNLGNVDFTRLPVPKGFKSLYATPVTVAYVGDATVDEATTEVATQLKSEGWIPYGDAGDVRYFRQNAIKLSARIHSAPGQGGKTVVDYSSELMSAELPAPDDAIDLQYSEPPVQLSFDTPKSMQELHDYYKQALAAGGWKATTDTPVKQDFRYFFIFRNPARDLIEATLTDIDGRTRALVKYQTAAEVDEIERRIKEKLKAKQDQQQ